MTVIALLAAAILLPWVVARLLFLRLVRAARAPPEIIRRFGAWAAAHPLRAWLKLRWPRLYAALAARLEPKAFRGLPLTLLAVAALYAAALFGGLIDEVREAGGVERFDHTVDGLLAPWRDPMAIRIFIWVTNLGDSATLSAVALVTTGLLWAQHQASLLLPLWLTVLGSQATTWITKFALARQRPDFVTEATALSPSFPSAHACGALAVYGFIAYLIARHRGAPGGRFDLVYGTVVLIALVGFSRVFLSVHFASDVAGGYLAGGFWLLVGFAVAESRTGRGK